MWQFGSLVPEGGFKAMEGPSNIQQQIDYVARTDGQPVYIGFANKGAATTDPVWLIQVFTYTTIAGSDYMATRKTAVGAWTDRATLTPT